MQASFFSDIMQRRPELFRAVLAFNGLTPPGGSSCLPGAENLPAAWTAVPGLDVPALLASRRFRRRFLPAAQAGFWDFGEETRRLALLPPEDLERLALTFGVCVHGAELARIVLREQVLAMREELGPELYLYAVRRGRFQLGSIRQFFLARDARESLAGRIRRHGRQAVVWCLDGWPEELRARCPGLPAGEERPGDMSPAARRALWFGLKKLLVKEVAPQWAACFD